METMSAAGTQTTRPAAPAAIADMYRLALLPVCLCWSGWMELLWPCHSPEPHHLGAGAGQQLVVPEPIEDTGEHALFA